MLSPKLWTFEHKTWPDFTFDMGGQGGNLEFEKTSHFLKLLDFQLFSQQALSKVVEMF